MQTKHFRLLLLGTLLFLALQTVTEAQFFQTKEQKRRNAQQKALLTSLKELAPTSAEKEAITHLRAAAIAEFNPREELMPKPEQAAPAAESDNDIGVDHRVYTIPAPLARQIMAHPAFAWSGLPIPLKNSDTFQTIDSVPAEPGFCQITGAPMPLQVRLLEMGSMEKLNALLLSLDGVECLQYPRVTFPSGQSGEIQDASQQPFVTSILPVGESVEGRMACQPVIQIFNEGVNVTTKATLLEDNSCRIDYENITLSKIESVDIVRLVDNGTVNGRQSGVSLQSPTVTTLSLTLPPVTIPENMSLLVAVPGLLTEDQSEGKFVLITPNREQVEEYVLKPESGVAY